MEPARAKLLEALLAAEPKMLGPSGGFLLSLSLSIYIYIYFFLHIYIYICVFL